MLKHKKSKRGIAVALFFVLAGIFIFIILFFAASNFVVKLFRTFDNTDESMMKLKLAIEEVATEYSPPGGKSITLQLDKESAIIGFNPGEGVGYLYESDEGDLTKDLRIVGAYMGRPDDCSSDSACLCTCENVDLESSELSCSYTECVSLEDVEFPEKSYMKDVFDDLKEAPGELVIYRRKYHYWKDSILLLRSAKIEPEYDGVWIVGGYSEYYPLKFITFFIKKVKNNPATVGICFKDDCFKNSCIYDKCEDVKDKDICANIKQESGCGQFQSECLWNDLQNLCLEKI